MRWVLTALALAGCAERVVWQPCNPVALAEYSAADQRKAAQELDGLREDAVVRRIVEDAGEVRAVLRTQPRCFYTR